MKQLFLLLIATLSLASLNAMEPTRAYCSISGSHLASQTNGYIGSVDICFDEQPSAKDYIVDEGGRRLNFETTIAALNYMAKAGWQLESTYTTYTPNFLGERSLDKIVIVMILSKEITSEEQITEGILTRKIFENRCS